MAKFRKKPVVIEAVRLEKSLDSVGEAVGFVYGYKEDDADAYNFGDTVANVLSDEGLYIHTLEGRMKADFGDWIIRGVAGEFYPCKPEIFEATYDAVTGEEEVPETVIAVHEVYPMLTEHFEDHKPYVFRRTQMARSKTGQDLLDSEWAVAADGHLVLDFSPNRKTGHVKMQDQQIMVFAEWCTELI